MASFATPTELQVYMGHAAFSAAEILTAQQHLDIATQIIKTYTRQNIERVDNDSVVLRRSNHSILLLPQVPVIAVDSVNDGSLLVVNDDYEWSTAGVLKRLYGSWRENTTVVYDHGYATVPEDIVGVCLALASRGFAGADNTDVEKEQMGPYAVTYRVAIAALESEEVATLNRYRAFQQVPV